MTATSNATPDRFLNRAQLEIINRRTLRYPLQIAEKDYFLALAIQLISNSPLKNELVFKGGTAIHHCYLPQYRFSEDLDFISLDTSINPEDILTVLETNNLFKANKIHTSKFTIKIERLQFEGLLGQPGNIKVEVDFMQNVVLPSKPKNYDNVWGIKAVPCVMDYKEISAEKLRAACQRARYRDFYDLYILVTELQVNKKAIIQLLRKKEIRGPITKDNMVKNWSIAKEQQADDLRSIYCKKTVTNHLIEKMMGEFDFDEIMPG